MTENVKPVSLVFGVNIRTVLSQEPFGTFHMKKRKSGKLELDVES